jgi:hypothetical protein
MQLTIFYRLLTIIIDYCSEFSVSSVAQKSALICVNPSTSLRTASVALVIDY